MGKGAGRGRKPTRGGRRQFTDVETLERQNRELSRRQNKLEEDDEDEDGNVENPSQVINRQGAVGDLPPSSDSNEESDEEDTKGAAAPKPAGNQTETKNKKIADLTLENLDITDPKRGLNRKEREELERQEAKKRYQALHAAGKTDEAKADLARLAIIRQQREEAAKKREAEKQAKEVAAKQRAAELAKAQGRKN